MAKANQSWVLCGQSIVQADELDEDFSGNGDGLCKIRAGNSSLPNVALYLDNIIYLNNSAFNTLDMHRYDTHYNLCGIDPGM